MNNLNKRIKEVRNSQKLSQAGFGERLNLSQSQIACYESGVRSVPQRVLNDIEREFCISKEWLLNGTGEMQLYTEDDLILSDALAEISLSDNETLKNITKQLIKLDEKYLIAIETLIDGLSSK